MHNLSEHHIFKMKEITFLLFALIISCSLTAATVDTVSIYSPSMHREIKCVIIKPDSYKKKKFRFPVVYLLHGHGGSYAYWVEAVPNIKSEADNYQMILVCPDGGFNSWYFDSPIDSTRKYETHISKEVVEYVDANYHTIANRNHRAITGLSMGGHGAFYIALRHTDIFGAVGSTSGGVDFTPFKTHWQIDKQIGDTINYKDNWINMTVINMIDHYPTGNLSIIFDCGIDDFFYQVNKQLHEKMLKLHILHDYIERPGKHTNEYWQNSITYQLLFFKNYFNKQKG
jgi:S-formylglutathione hydrolase FrmB